MNRLVFTFLLFALSLSAVAQTEPEPVDAEKLEQANAQMLRKVVEQQRKEIAELKEQVKMLTEQLQSFGLAPARDGAATQPAEEVRDERVPPKRVVYVLLSHVVAPEVARAVNELSDEQWFNIVIAKSDGSVVLFQPQLSQANRVTRPKASEFLDKAKFSASPRLLSGLEVAAKARPDVIWVVGRTDSRDADGVMKEVHRINLVSKSRINTTTINALLPEDFHLLWRIAHETGGVCVDKNGNPIDEPKLPPNKPAPPATRPSILKE